MIKAYTEIGKASRLAYMASAIAVLGFMNLPLVAILPVSFNPSDFLSYPSDGFSLRWYQEVISSSAWVSSLKNSLVIGVLATTLAVILGTLAALGINMADFPGKKLVSALIISPMAVPIIISAVGLYFFFAELGIVATYTSMVLSHTLLGTPFVFITVNATLRGFDFTLVKAAQNLGANPTGVFFKVVLPLIMPGVLAGALFAFAISFDEVVVSLFIAGPEQRTLPIQMFAGLRENITPAIVAVATLLTLFSAILLLALEALKRRR
ncbi:ABC transporter permease [Halomonas sp. KAO]|uniref:ABC transporter permease n=1 Tax=Halomonas sp. KAO TaxID=2783858 RepID=UPI0018A08D1A|nr:ABC transporter permease [Halomonas sp. KAO]MBF7051906.1 ABC transporter permease [Halomonas sp. KAO]